MVLRVLPPAILLCLTAPAWGDVLLWDNGEPDMRHLVGIPTRDTSDSVRGTVSAAADDFENSVWWKVPAISLDGIFGSLKRGRDDPGLVVPSQRVELRIYKAGSDGGPGELLWSTKLGGEAAGEAQAFYGGAVDLAPMTHCPVAPLPVFQGREGRRVEVTVEESEGLVTLPPGRWFVSWRILASDNNLSFWCLASPCPLRSYGNDTCARTTVSSPDRLERSGREPPWQPASNHLGRECNLSFKIYGQVLDGPPKAEDG